MTSNKQNKIERRGILLNEERQSIDQKAKTRKSIYGADENFLNHFIVQCVNYDNIRRQNRIRMNGNNAKKKSLFRKRFMF